MNEEEQLKLLDQEYELKEIKLCISYLKKTQRILHKCLNIKRKIFKEAIILYQNIIKNNIN